MVDNERYPILKSFVWVALSTFAYYAVVETVIMSSEIDNTLSANIVFFLAGMVGAAIVFIGLKISLFRLSLRYLIPLVVIGGGLGFTFHFGTTSDEQLLYLYVLWQSGMALAISVAAWHQNMLKAPKDPPSSARQQLGHVRRAWLKGSRRQSSW